MLILPMLPVWFISNLSKLAKIINRITRLSYHPIRPTDYLLFLSASNRTESVFFVSQLTQPLKPLLTPSQNEKGLFICTDAEGHEVGQGYHTTPFFTPLPLKKYRGVKLFLEIHIIEKFRK